VTDSAQRLTAALADRYRIERELGQGGMATVYLAQDVKHDRKVALKVLRPELAAVIGGERFLAEIKTTANLQHPHILSLFDSGDAAGIVYYVMPYVEGESLRDRLHRERQLPIDEAVRIATEVASALDYAHRHGVVHRDIKPENILLHDGSAMVADFGIALAVSRSEGGTRMTETGMSLGTPYYMSPEQAMGEREITAKSDVYALGAVLYEMLTGEPPFTGPSAQAIIARVVTEEPRSLTLQRKTIPPHVEAAVETALAKLPADRFATAAQFAEALNKPGAMPATLARTAVTRAAAPALSRRSALIPWGIALVTGAAALWAWLGRKPAAPLAPLARFGIQLPRDAEPVGATGSTISFSPDGSRIVYVGRAPSGQRLYVRGLDQLDPVPVPGSDGGILPFFSADGQWLGFKQDNRLVKVALAGGPVTPVCDAPGETYGATWTPGDTIIFAGDSGLMDVPAAGGTAHVLARPGKGESFRWPEALPGGRVVLFTAMEGRVLKLAALTRSTGEVKRLTQTGGYPRYVSAGFVVLTDPSGIISAVPFDARRLETTGNPVPMADKVIINTDGDVNLGVSRSGAFAYQGTVAFGSRLLLVDRRGAAREAGSDTGFYYMPRLSPDDRRVAVFRFTDVNLAAGDVWVMDLLQHTRTRLTFDTVSGVPAWTPDGRRIAYTRFPKGILAGPTGSIYWVPADGSGTPESLVVAPGRWIPAGFAAGGRELVYSGGVLGSKTQIRRLDLAGSRTDQQFLATNFNNYNPSLSPDGHWIAYVSDESGRPEVYVRPFPGPGGRWQVSLDGGQEPVWSRAGGEIFFRNADKMMAAQVRTQPGFEVLGRSQLFTGSYDQAGRYRDYDVTRDGQTFVMFQPAQSTALSVFVTLNWFGQFRRRK